jgi:WD40 repeat protein
MRQATYSLDGSRIVTVARGLSFARPGGGLPRRGAVYIFPGSDPQEVEQIAHDKPVAHAALSPDGRQVVTTFEDGTVRLWDATTGEPVRDLVATPSALGDVPTSPDGTDIVSRPRPMDAPKEPSGSAGYAAFSPDGAIILTVAGDRVRLWDTKPRALLGKRLRHGDKVLDAAFSPNGERLATASDDSAARIWDTQSGRPVGVSTEYAEGEEYPAAAAVPPVDTSARDKKAAKGRKVIELAPKVVVLGQGLDHDGPVTRVRFGPEGARLVTLAGGRFRLWDGRSGKPLATPAGYAPEASDDPPPGHGADIADIFFSPDGARLFAQEPGRVSFWSAHTGEKLPTAIQAPDFMGVRVYHTALTRDGKRIATMSAWPPTGGHRPGSGTIPGQTAGAGLKIWNLQTDSLASGLTIDNGFIVDISPDARTLVVHSREPASTSEHLPPRMTTRLVNVRTERAFGAALKDQAHAPHMAAFSPTGAHVFTQDEAGKTSRLWDAETGEPVGKPWEHGQLTAYAFGPDGKSLAIATGKDAGLWQIRPRKRLGTMTHEEAIGHLAFGPFGRTIVTTSDDKTARLWEVSLLTSPTALVDALAGVTSYRVCKRTLEAVAVSPKPPPSAIWAPEALCDQATE